MRRSPAPVILYFMSARFRNKIRAGAMRSCLLSNEVICVEQHIVMMKKAAETGELLEVYTNREETDRFNVGRILAMDEEWYVFAGVCSDGRRDGVEVRRLDEVFMACADTEYVRCVALLADPDGKDDFHSEEDVDLRLQLLEYAKASGSVVSVELLDSDNWDAVGFVESLEEGIVVRCLTREGRPDGRNAFRLEDISEISCGSEDEQKVARLAQARESKQ